MSNSQDSIKADFNQEDTKVEDEDLTPAGRKKVVWTKKRIIFVALFVLLVLISVAVLIMMIIDKDFLYNMVNDYFVTPLGTMCYWSIFLFLVIIIFKSLIVPIPSELILLSGGILYGFWIGTTVGVIGSVLSGVITFYISNKGGRPILEVTGDHIGFADKFLLAMDLWIEKWGIWAIIAGRAVPIVMFDPISYAAGISDIEWKPYTLATFVGSIPRAAVYAWLGAQSIIAPEWLNTIFYVIFGVLILMLIVATFVGNRVQKKAELAKSQTTDEE